MYIDDNAFHIQFIIMFILKPCTGYFVSYSQEARLSILAFQFPTRPLCQAVQYTYMAFNEETDDVRSRKITGIGKFAIISTATQLAFDASLSPSIFSWTG